MEKRVEEFDVQASDGRVFRLMIYAKLIDNRSMSNPHARPLEGELKTVLTSEGYRCRQIDEDTWEILDLGLMTKRVR